MRIEEEININDWQMYFDKLRDKIKPSNSKYMPAVRLPLVNGCRSNDYFTHYDGTQWVYYRNFINSILRSIRHGKCDYCYHVFQVADLLKYEHDNLKVEWIPKYECFKVSLKKLRS